MTIRVLLTDDQALLRSTFRLLLDSAPDIDVVGEAADGAEAVTRVRADQVDVVLMDIRMPGMDGIEATRRISADDALTGVKILVLTTFDDDDLVIEALRAGASGFLGKGVDPTTLLDAVRTVAAGESLLSPQATRALISRLLSQPSAQPRAGNPGFAALTKREREITDLVAIGLSNDEIAQRLFISAATAKTHVNRAMMKTGARDRAQLVVFTYENAGGDPRGRTT